MELGGVVGGGRFNVPVASLKEARFQTTLRQQYDFSCGSAAVATLLSHHYDYPVSEQFVFEQMYLHGDQQKIRKEGFSLLDIKRFLAAHGFVADGFELPLHKLGEAGSPAIVLLSEQGYQHFVVVKGLSPSRVLIGDPAGGTRALARDSFEAMWRSKLLFVIHGHAGPVRFNEAADWRVAPPAPLAAAVNRNGLDLLTMPKLGPGEF
ncbi:C39 family peptidase [Janthinobacterium sp. hw3]|uniref:C39 family peptidase n=2 Tax=Janthinobacterium fluminis TaxID=2987524 RepID=A0ABT5K7I1_9BURK|nr:C39 family peptidase [Janthinobacterium fluminis]MDC8760967.1 C39 family peptidase [Janthinobacterium fluminis]